MSRVATIWIKDEVNITVMGLDDSSKKVLFDKFGYFVKGYIHRPQYKLGVWDGKKRFFSKLGNSYVHLLEDIVPLVIELGYGIKIRDDRIMDNLPRLQTDNNPFPEYRNEDGEPFELRPYQVEAVNAVLDENGGIMIAGTGAGKTSMSGTIVKMYETAGYNTIIIVPNTTLVKQSADDLKKWGLDVGQYDGTIKELNRRHLVSTWQSLQNVPTLLAHYDVVIVDECQAAQASVLAKLLEENGRHIQFRFGLTGTMPDDPVDNLQVRLMLGSIKYTISAKMLIDLGYLSTLNIEMMQLNEQVDPGFFPDYASEIAYLQTNPDRSKWIAEFVQLLAEEPDGNVLMLVSSKAHGRKLAKAIPGSHFVSGDDKTDARAIIYQLFSSNSNIIVIATAQVGGVGLSIDRVFNLVMLDIGKSFIRVIQGIGRGLRKNIKAGKFHCNVYDIASSLKFSKIHAKKRVKYYRESEYPTKQSIINYKKAA
jgi:superfamily II DNA or RNA helicase